MRETTQPNAPTTTGPLMSQPIGPLTPLLVIFAGCFRVEAFATFQAMVAAWALCPAPHTISEVWQTAALAGRFHHDRAYSLFSDAKWDWDDLGRLLIVTTVARLVPFGMVWLVVDDTLCHKRGAKVALGGFFLDPVTSSKKHKNFRFAVNWVVLGVVVCLPFRPDRYVCLPVLWRAYRKKGVAGHREKTLLAADLARLACECLPGRDCWLVADSAYMNRDLLKDRPENLKVIGPIRWDGALFGPPPQRREGQRGAPRKKGDRLPTPKKMIEDTLNYPAEVSKVKVANKELELRTQVVSGVSWYHVAGAEAVSVVLVRDPSGRWRDEALVATTAEVSAAEVVAGYCRRWSVEVAFFESKQFLGLHDPQVRCEASVERAHPMAWFVLSVTILWYAEQGEEAEHPRRDRPWYQHKKSPTLADMLGALRLELWVEWINGMSCDRNEPPEIPEILLHWLAAVR